MQDLHLANEINLLLEETSRPQDSHFCDMVKHDCAV